MNKFWNWKNAAEPEEPNKELEQAQKGEAEKNVLFLHGAIADESWFDDDVTPKMFRDELEAHCGDITVYINSPGGDCIAASEIYTMLMEHKGHVTVKIDGMAASAASVIAMAGTTVLMAPTAMMMIHNPATAAFGDHNEMKAVAKMLDEVKDSIIKAYDLKTNLGHDKISSMMEAETWMSADKAISLGFADGIITSECGEEKKKKECCGNSYSYSRKSAEDALYAKIAARYSAEKKEEEKQDDGSVPVEELMNRLDMTLVIK